MRYFVYVGVYEALCCILFPLIAHDFFLVAVSGSKNKCPLPKNYTRRTQTVGLHHRVISEPPSFQASNQKQASPEPTIKSTLPLPVSFLHFKQAQQKPCLSLNYSSVSLGNVWTRLIIFTVKIQTQNKDSVVNLIQIVPICASLYGSLIQKV